MNKYRLNIDGKEVYGLPGQTILDVCRENDIFIRLSATTKEQKFTAPAVYVW